MGGGPCRGEGRAGGCWRPGPDALLSPQKPVPAKAEPKPKKLAAKVRQQGRGEGGEVVVRLAVQAPGDFPPHTMDAWCLNVFIHLIPFPFGLPLLLKDRFGVLVVGPTGALETFMPSCLVRPL